MSADPRAHAAVATAVRNGDLQPATSVACEAGCGRMAQCWHHHSYKPEHRLDVIGLCRSCHLKVHWGSIAEPRTGRVYESSGRMGAANDLPKPTVEDVAEMNPRQFALASKRLTLSAGERLDVVASMFGMDRHSFASWVGLHEDTYIQYLRHRCEAAEAVMQ